MNRRAPRRWGVIRHCTSVSAAPVPVMFTLCMSRGHPPLQDSYQHNHFPNKQIKGGYLLRYRRGFFCKGWSEEWIVLYEDSTIAFYADKGLSRSRGRVRINEAPDLLAVGEWTRQVPKPPRIPRSCHIGQLLVIGNRCPQEVHWLMAQSPAEVNDWMTAISNTLPPPPHLPLENKSCSATPLRNGLPCNHTHLSSKDGTTTHGEVRGSTVSTIRKYEPDHTVLSGVVIDWGHGWGWGQSSAWAAQASCAHDYAGVNAALYCHTAEDYALGGYDEVDWSAFGDFCF